MVPKREFNAHLVCYCGSDRKHGGGALSPGRAESGVSEPRTCQQTASSRTRRSSSCRAGVGVHSTLFDRSPLVVVVQFHYSESRSPDASLIGLFPRRKIAAPPLAAAAAAATTRFDK